MPGRRFGGAQAGWRRSQLERGFGVDFRCACPQRPAARRIKRHVPGHARPSLLGWLRREDSPLATAQVGGVAEVFGGQADRPDDARRCSRLRDSVGPAESRGGRIHSLGRGQASRTNRVFDALHAECDGLVDSSRSMRVRGYRDQADASSPRQGHRLALSR